MSEEVIIKSLSEDGVLTLTFNRPHKKNAFNRPAWAELRDTFISAKDNPKVACIILQGAGNDFSSGMDLADFGGEGDTDEHPFYSAQKSVINFDKHCCWRRSDFTVSLRHYLCRRVIAYAPTFCQFRLST